MPTAKLSRVSKYGFQVFGGDGSWINLSKYEKDLSLAGVKAGDTVDYELEKGFVVKLTKTGSAPADAGSNGSCKASSGGSARSSEPDGKDLRISRLSALSTAFGEPFKTFAAGEQTSEAEAVQMAFKLADDMVKYANTGVLPTAEGK